jgi:hypothetical protein
MGCYLKRNSSVDKSDSRISDRSRGDCLPYWSDVNTVYLNDQHGASGVSFLSCRRSLPNVSLTSDSGAP